MRPLHKTRLIGSCTLLGLVLAGCTGSVTGKKPGDGTMTPSNMPPGATATGTGSTGAGAGSGTGVSVAPSGGGGGAVGAGATVGTTIPAGAGGAASPAAACDGMTGRRLRRLSIREYSNVVTTLLGAPAAATAVAAITPEPTVNGFDNQADSLYVSASFQNDIADVAATLSSQANPTTLAPCTTAAGSPTCLQTFLQSFGTQAFGRPLAADEMTRLTTLASMGQDYATQVRLAVEYFLQSPGLLYVSELGSPTAPVASGKAIPLTQYEIANQLSFMLTGNRPDATLLKNATTTGFAQSSDILSEAQRLLTSDPRAQDSLSRFINGWMDMSPLSANPKDPSIYPSLTPAIMTAMQQEFDQFVKTQLTGPGTLDSFMMTSSTNVPTALAPIYGADLTATGVDPSRRKGILSLPAVLAVHSAPDNSGPVERGLLIRRQLLCQYVPGPPQDALDKIANNPIDPADMTATTRQKLDAHLNEPSCAACHATFDPIGYGFEQMDGIGRYRAMEAGQTVDSTGMLTGTTAADGSKVDGAFVGPAQLSTMLSQSKLVESCMTEHFFNFAQARATIPSDSCVISGWASKFSSGGGHIKDLVLSAVVDPNFANRKDDR